MASLHAESFVTHAEIFTRLASRFGSRKHPPFECVVVDEAQDLSVAQLTLLAAMGGERANSIFFAGDLGQRIFQQPFSWKRWGWMFAAGRERCALTIAGRIRSECKLTDC